MSRKATTVPERDQFEVFARPQSLWECSSFSTGRQDSPAALFFDEGATISAVLVPTQYRGRVKRRLRVLAYAEEHGLSRRRVISRSAGRRCGHGATAGMQRAWRGCCCAIRRLGDDASPLMWSPLSSRRASAPLHHAATTGAEQKGRTQPPHRRRRVLATTFVRDVRRRGCCARGVGAAL